jgi:hypothetical protein
VQTSNRLPFDNGPTRELVIAGVKMPELNGCAALAEQRRYPTWPLMDVSNDLEHDANLVQWSRFDCEPCVPKLGQLALSHGGESA